MEVINNFQQEPDETLYQAWERFKELLMKFPQHYLTEMQEVILFYNGLEVPTRQILDSKGAIPTKTAADVNVGCEQCKGPHYTKYCPLKEEGKTLKEAYYTQFGVPFQKGGQYRATAPGFYQMNNANPSYQEQRQSMEESLSKFMDESAKRHDKLMFESRQTTIPFPSHLNDYYCDEKKGSYRPEYLDAYSYGATRIDDSKPRKEKDPGSFTLPCLGKLARTKLTVELADKTVKHSKGIAENVLVGIGKLVFPVDFIILDMPEDVKVSLILGGPFLSIAHAKIDVFKRKITLRVGEEKIIFKSVKPASSLIKRVYMLSLREHIELDLEAGLIGETLVLNRLLDPLYEDYIELNDLNVPLELRRNQVDDLMPTIEEGEVVDKHMIEEVKARNDNKMVSKIFGYPNDFDEDEKIHKVEFRGRNELGNFANVPVFIGNFYVVTDFTVVEDLDPYLDEGIGEVVVGEPF
ncbi:putative reverse transcriptase domain-containing protein [Tanacetum coccineum]